MTHSPFHINVLILFTSLFLLKYSHNCGLKERNRTSVFRATTGRSAIELPTTYGMPGETRTHILWKEPAPQTGASSIPPLAYMVHYAGLELAASASVAQRSIQLS